MLYRLNDAELEDIALGACWGLLPWFHIGPWAIITAIISSFFWYAGGRWGNSFQVYGCSSTVWIPIIAKIGYLGPFQWTALVFAWVSSGIVMGFGYGIPDQNDPDGSTLGRFFYRLFKGNLFLANLFTRGTIYILLIGLFLISFLVR